MTNINYPTVINWTNAHTNIIMTVALPVLNSEKIIWLALESLKNQKNINFEWELLIMEEFGKSANIVKKFLGLLPGCKRVCHYSINPKTHGLKTGKFKGRFLLINKWIDIAKGASKTSKIYVLHAADCYSSPKRLYIHKKHFENNNCYFSTQPRGLFYNLKNGKFVIYNAYKTDFKNKKFFIGNHLNMALRTKDMLKIKPKSICKGIDNYIRRSLESIHKINLSKNKYIFTDDEIDPHNWKYSIDTDGLNNISLTRTRFYDKPTGKWLSYNRKGELRYKGIEAYIPVNVRKFIYKFKKNKKLF